jgi:hypothetical protein
MEKVLTYEELADAFDEALDESYPIFAMGVLQFLPSQILKECDPIAYNCYMAEFEADYLESLEK